MSDANSKQVAGKHYRFGIQVWDAIVAWDCGYLAGNIIKYVARYKQKNGLEDLHKARHYLDKLIEVEEAAARKSAEEAAARESAEVLFG